MPKLTDEEVGQLLRETFTEKEELLNHLPEATTPPVRRKAPVLLAAAAVLVVFAGIAVATGLERGPNTQPVAQSPAPPMQTVPVGKVEPKHFNPGSAYLAGVAIAELTKWERPAGGWPVVRVLDASYSQASSPTEAGGKGTPLSKRDQASIAGSAGVPIEWVQSRPTGPDVCDQANGTPYVTLGPVVFNESRSSATIGMSMWRGCLDAQWLTYRLVPIITPASNVYESSVRSWKVAGTVGPVAVS
ncbi:hypothetical protein OHA70_14435 [Kribbella sp. NBC_00382]|uniref:hypothetical protein n=1 Tax=Kribbella sp. NBC_00382 TaxID=2975967 RepID=UPI002E1A6DAC